MPLLAFIIVAIILVQGATFRNVLPNEACRPAAAASNNMRTIFQASVTTDGEKFVNGDEHLHQFTDELSQSLDLVLLLEAVSRHAGTRRGRQSLLALVGADYQEKPQPSPFPSKISQDALSAKQRRLLSNSVGSDSKSGFSRSHSSAIAVDKEAAQEEYDVVAQALSVLRNNEDCSYPPIYGSDSSPWDTENSAETDYDNWLELSAEESTLEHILQAEKLVETFVLVRDWAASAHVKEMAPTIAKIGRGIETDELKPVLHAIAGTVKISRVRTLTDPGGKSTFNFQLNEERFHVIKILRDQVEEAAERLGKGGRQKSSREGEFENLLGNLAAAEDEIRFSLFQLIIGNSAEINSCMNIVARLDIIFAKAAFALSTGGLIPIVGTAGEISVKQFVHPVLLCSAKTATPSDIVPIDLELSSAASKKALIISGANGGGKTVAMKSFAICCICCKLGLPIPCREDAKDPSLVPHVDFFDDIHVTLGDNQSLVGGQSTMMAQLNACSAVLEKVSNAKPERSSLVLFDELGGGTDPTAGGAIAQAILEKLLDAKGCRVVATTHVPRLKVLSYQSDQFGCATVLLEPAPRSNDGKQYQGPSYRLLYDSVGDSYALGAASRSTPSFPPDVLSRAAQLLATPTAYSPVSDGDVAEPSTEDPSYLQVLTASMEQQRDLAQSVRKEAEEYKRDMFACQKGMLAVASSYDRQFQLLESKLEDMFQRLQGKESSDLELLGDTLGELRLKRKVVKSQAEQLKEKGLKLLPESQDLHAGDTVVIVSDDEMNGISATVVSAANLPQGLSLQPDDVAVTQSMASWDFEGVEADSFSFSIGKTLILKRSQIAVWDYDSVWEDDSLGGADWASDVRATNVKDSNRKLNDILSTIKTKSSSPPGKKLGSTVSAKRTGSFSSSRERKAAAKQAKKSKRRM